MRHNALYLKCIFINPQEEKNECCNLGLSYLCKGEAIKASVQFSSVAQPCPTPFNPSARPPSPSPIPGVYTNSSPLSLWCHPTISSSVVSFSSCLQSLPASGSFQMSQLFASGGQSTGVSASMSVFPMNTQDCSPLGWTGWISLQCKELSRVFSNATVQKHQFFGIGLLNNIPRSKSST